MEPKNKTEEEFTDEQKAWLFEKWEAEIWESIMKNPLDLVAYENE